LHRSGTRIYQSKVGRKQKIDEEIKQAEAILQSKNIGIEAINDDDRYTISTIFNNSKN
jgi:hypothetical protein